VNGLPWSKPFLMDAARFQNCDEFLMKTQYHGRGVTLGLSAFPRVW
jgi:hypothetical protein